MQGLTSRDRLVVILQVIALVAVFIVGGLIVSGEPEHACEYRACSDTRLPG